MFHTYQHMNLGRYAVIPIWYSCNNNCSICMLSRVKDRIPNVDFPTFRGLINALVNDGGYDSLILSGAEITTCDHLEHYARYAASFGYFKKIQIQTNGRKLADQRFLHRLINAGINEFFISVHGPEEIHDAITRVPGSYRETMAGIVNLAACDVNVVSNTVLTTLNYRHIVPLVRDLCAAPVSEINIWNLFPMESRDSRNLVVSLTDLAALLPDIMAAGQSAGKAVVFKGFPECLAPGAPCFFDNTFPLNLIHDSFWGEFAANGFGTCVYKYVCGAGECWGLSSAYIAKFGDERSRLVPFRLPPEQKP